MKCHFDDPEFLSLNFRRAREKRRKGNARETGNLKSSAQYGKKVDLKIAFPPRNLQHSRFESGAERREKFQVLGLWECKILNKNRTFGAPPKPVFCSNLERALKSAFKKCFSSEKVHPRRFIREGSSEKVRSW